jgi:predicted ATPase
LQIVRLQQAKSLELQAATSLARLWRQLGRAQEAHLLLAEVLDWFSEGYETADLQKAQILLAELENESTKALPIDN